MSVCGPMFSLDTCSGDMYSGEPKSCVLCPRMVVSDPMLDGLINQSEQASGTAARLHAFQRVYAYVAKHDLVISLMCADQNASGV